MSSNLQTRQKRNRHLSSVDLRINRVIGILILVIGAALAYSLVFTEFPHRVQFQWEVNNEGERIPITHITCPSPWSVVTDDAKPVGVVSGDLCVLPARGHLIQGVGIVLLALPLAIWVFTREPRRRPMPTLAPW